LYTGAAKLFFCFTAIEGAPAQRCIETFPLYSLRRRPAKSLQSDLSALELEHAQPLAAAAASKPRPPPTNPSCITISPYKGIVNPFAEYIWQSNHGTL